MIALASIQLIGGVGSMYLKNRMKEVCELLHMRNLGVRSTNIDVTKGINRSYILRIVSPSVYLYYLSHVPPKEVWPPDGSIELDRAVRHP